MNVLKDINDNLRKIAEFDKDFRFAQTDEHKDQIQIDKYREKHILTNNIKKLTKKQQLIILKLIKQEIDAEIIRVLIERFDLTKDKAVIEINKMKHELNI